MDLQSELRALAELVRDSMVRTNEHLIAESSVAQGGDIENLEKPIVRLVIEDAAAAVALGQVRRVAASLPASELLRELETSLTAHLAKLRGPERQRLGLSPLDEKEQGRLMARAIRMRLEDLDEKR